MAGRPRSFEHDRVLTVAMELFWQHGYDGTSLGDVERETGLGRQSLYNSFGDKRALFEQAVEHYCAQVLKPSLDALSAPGSPRAHLEAMFAGWEEIAMTDGFRGCLVGNSAASLENLDPQMQDLLARKLRLIEEALVRVLRRAVTEREVPADLDVVSTARSLMVIAQGLSIVARVRKSRPFIRSVIDSARRLLG